MENQYNNALKKIRANSSSLEKPYSERLFDHDWQYFDEQDAVDAIPAKVAETASEANTEVTPEPSKTVTEKVKVLDELHRFGHEQFEKSNSDKVALKGGGELLKKVSSVPTWEIQALSNDEMKTKFFEQHSVLGSSKFESEDQQLDVLFVNDEDIKSSINQELDHQKLSVFYDDEVATLFQRMIFAMKLDKNKYSISSLLLDTDGAQDLVLNEIYQRDPKYIVSLGGYVTSHLLKTKERLAQLRGSFHKVAIEMGGEQKSFELLPLFSPNYLNEAPNSKRLAWEDMQKLMEKLA